MAVVRSRLAALTWNRLFAIAFGIVFLLLGAAAVAVSFGRPPFDPAGVPLLIVFTANSVQGVVTLVTGAVLLVPGIRSLRAARLVNRIMGTVLLVGGIAGLYLIGTPANVLALNASDVLVQFTASAFLLGASFGADRDRDD